MTSSRPYLLRALHEWVLNNEMTPYVVVDASFPDVDVPRDFVSNGQIVLNISPSAVKGLVIGNDYVEFGARFGGVPTRVTVPVEAVLAVYAKENGQGMVFGAEPGNHPDPEPPSRRKPASSSVPARSRPSLKVVK